MAGLTAQPLGPQGSFNWVFLVELLVCGILSLFFLFYFNRLFATVISYAIRAYTWHKFRAYIDIRALQISLLGGRLFFKSVRYHAHNETILVYDGHVTWRYWLRAVQEAEVFDDEDVHQKRNEQPPSSSVSEKENEKEHGSRHGVRSRSAGKAEKGGKQRRELPCRISVKVSGVEAFIYNRSPVYDNIVEATKKARGSPNSAPNHDTTREEPASPASDSSDSKPAEKINTRSTRIASTVESVSPEHYKKPEIPAWLNMLPMKIDCKRAAAALGNEHTTSVITAKLETASGTIDAAQAGPLDQFKLLFNFDFRKVNVAMKPNRDFKQLQLDAAQRILRERVEQPESPKHSLSPFHGIVTTWRKIKHALTWRRGTGSSIRTTSMQSDVKQSTAMVQDQVPGQAQWHGLSRYLDDNDLNGEWEDVEYAKFSTLVDCERIGMRFYFDMPGKVPNNIADSDQFAGSMYADDANRWKPPDYGIDLFVHGGIVTYGPWADRQRVNLQHVFVPMTYVDASLLKPLKPGATRAWTKFKIKVIVEEDVTLRIPMREPSKDSKWQGRSNGGKTREGAADNDGKGHGKHRRRQRHGKRRKGKNGPSVADARPCGWLDIAVKADSVVNYDMDMFARGNGYRNTLDLDIKSTEMTSSVNHGLLWRAGQLTLDADLSNPISWNSSRSWPFNITCNALELFILRDHMFLITDLVNDWSSGPPPEFYTFVPYVYTLNLTFQNFILYLNTNDANIINDPAELDKNDFLTIEGRNLDAVLGIPIENFRPGTNGMTFDVLAQDLSMRLLNTSRNTLSTLLEEKRVAELPRLTLKGSYTGNLESAPDMTDVLRMDLVGTGMYLKAYGFVVRHFINVKENYFGDYVHFKTLEEFQDAGNDLQKANEETASFPKPQQGNELDVILCIIAEQATVMLPTNIYSMKEFVRADLPMANIDLRITSYYFDMGINFSPIGILADSSITSQDSASDSATSTQIFISHVDLTGHRLFGLKPNEPSYAEEWGVDVGPIKGECSSGFVHNLTLAAKAFMFAFQDGENALPIASPVTFYNATFLQLRTDILRIWLHVGKDALLLSTLPVSVDFNDWAGETFSQRVSVLVPSMTIACVDARGVSRHCVKDGRRRLVKTSAFLETGVNLDVVRRKLHFGDERRKQQAHIRRNDKRTGRAPFLIHSLDSLPPSGGTVGMAPTDSVAADLEPPAMPVPGLPAPLDEKGRPLRRHYSSTSVRSLRRGRSLCSKSSTSSFAASIRGQNLAVPPWSSRACGLGNDTPSEASSRSLHSSSPGSLKDREPASFSLAHSNLAYASPFAQPNFPLDDVKPDETNVPRFRDAQHTDDDVSNASSTSEIVDDLNGDHDSEHTAIFINTNPGIRAYVEPRVVAAVSELLGVIQPKDPEGIMDNFQEKVMDAITVRQKAHLGKGNVLEVHADLPSAQLRVAISGEEVVPDTVDLSISALEFMLRIKNSAATGYGDLLAMHVTLSRLSASLQEGIEVRPTDLALRSSIDDVLIWVTSARSTSLHVSVRETAILALSRKAEYMMDLGLKLVPLVQQVQSELAATVDNARKRLHVLVYELTQQSENAGDPSYMARMTYILRAFPDHYRNQESWKVLARFRHMLHCAPKDAVRVLKQKFDKGDLKYPKLADTKALEDWAQWRNWDVPNVSHTIALLMLFGDEETSSAKASDPKSIAMTWKSEVIRVSIDEGRNASEMLIEETSLELDITPPTVPTGLMLVEDNTRTQTLLQLHTSSIGFVFDWGLCDLVEGVLPRAQQLAPNVSSQPSHQHRSASQALEEGLNRHDFHVAISTSNGSIVLQSINLRHRSQAENLKMSLIGTTQANDQWGQCASALINADVAVTELYSQTRCIWETLLTSPSIYIDHVQLTDGVEEPSTVNLAVAYGELRIDTKEQIPGILHVVDMVILDEAIRIKGLVKAAQKATPTVSVEGSALTTNKPATKLQVALLAGELSLGVSLLQALEYRLEGTAASIRLAPSLSHKDVLGIDFDVGRQTHSFVNTRTAQSHERGLLDVPPINGHVGLQLQQHRTDISVAVTVEKIEVDAAAIHGLLAVANRPEVQHVIAGIGTSVQEIKQHSMQSFPEAPSATFAAKPEGIKQIVFDARTALLGVRIACTTPQIAGDTTAELEVGIGPFHAMASNRAIVNAGGNSLIPEIRAQVQNIRASLAIREKDKHRPCGNVNLSAMLHADAHKDRNGNLIRELTVRSPALEANAYPETAATIVDVINHLEDRMKDLDLSKEVDYLRRLRDSRKHVANSGAGSKTTKSSSEDEAAFSAADLLAIQIAVELNLIQATWHVHRRFSPHPQRLVDDPILSLARVELTTRGGNEARLIIQDLQLQLVPQSNTDKIKRTLNSALLPEVSFSVAYWSRSKDKSLALKATGKPLDLRLESSFIVSVNAVQRSVQFANVQFKAGTASWQGTPTTTGAPRQKLFGSSRITAVLVEAGFAGAQVYLQGSGPADRSLAAIAAASQEHGAHHGRYGQFAPEGSTMQTTLKAPGIALKVEYRGVDRQPTVHGELRVDASTNMLLPNVVPLVLEISNSVKLVMQNQDDVAPTTADTKLAQKAQQRFFEEESFVAANPSAFFGKTKVNLGLRICRQEFGLTCQPIAKVDAKAELDDLYFTMNTIDSEEHGHFFAMSAVLSKLNARVKHVYSREPTFSFDMDSIVLSLMNSKHFSGVNGVSAILKFNPTKLFVSGKQLQDLLLFREIWLPPELRNKSQSVSPLPHASQADEYLVQRYHTVAAAAAFPWNATVTIAELDVDLDLGQNIGKSSFTITNLWASSQKTSNWEQNLCVGLDEVAMTSTGRMSGFIRLTKLGIRTSITWPEREQSVHKSPLVQASIGFQRLRAKAAFDYQAFAFADIERFDFLTYNVRENKGNDRLVAVLDCEKAYVFCTSTSPAQALALYQAFDRLIQEKQTAYMQSLNDIEKHLRRASTVVPTRFGPQIPGSPIKLPSENKSPISLHTDVVVTVGTISVGAFPSTFFDSQILKLEATNIQARFAVGPQRGRVHSGLGMTLGQLQVALASVKRVSVPKTLGDISVEEVISNAVGSKGGTILRVPKVVASMQTWQEAYEASNKVDYIFRSLFDGKIDVGWNLARINFIKGMYTTHTRSLASRLGKKLPESAVKITAGPQHNAQSGTAADLQPTDRESEQQQQKITAEVSLPQSRYEYRALEPPVIETPQLRDMGEATPPLEWVGLNRDRLPNVTHQIIIVSLLEVAREVEEAYGRILGGS